MALFIYSVKPIDGKQVFSWALLGLRPYMNGLSAGERLPRGVLQGENSLGQSRYSICPRKGSRVRYHIALFALPYEFGAENGFFSGLRLERASQLAIAKAEIEAFYRRK